MNRSRKSRVIAVVVPCVAAIAVAVPVLASPGHSSQPANRGVPAASGSAPKFDNAVAACEKRSKICDSSAASQYPLGVPDPPDATVMSSTQVASALGWANDVVGATEMTYGQAQQAYPTLAAASSVVVDPSREVWVITDYPKTARSMPRYDGWGPPQSVESTPSPSTSTISTETVVVDAVTGTETDACDGCSDIPPPAPGS
jgi:hypothetical protein